MSNIKISIDDFGGTIADILAEYAGDIDKTVEAVTMKCGEDGAEMLKDTSPKRTGKYAGGWRVKKKRKGNSTHAIIYNGTKPTLTHLLEYGHATRNGGRAQPIPHITPAEDKVYKEFEDAIMKAIAGK